MKIARIFRAILRLILTLFGLILNPLTGFIFHLVYDKNARKVPPIQNEILLQSATRLAQRIRQREVKAVTVMEAFIDRVKTVNPIVNAVVANRFDEAIKEARAVDSLLDGGDLSEEYSENKAPWLGVPLSVKEAFALSGMPNSSGLLVRQGTLATSDASVVVSLKKAGVIPFIVTNTSELCMWYESANHLYGRTKNPYDTARIVGGSSGGEGCIIAAGGAVIGIGSDIGGSIRMPAFFCGIFGHRTSKGVVPNDGQFPSPTANDMDLLSTGPMCRYAEDLKPMLQIMAGNNARMLKLDQKVDLGSLKYYTMEDDGGSLLASNVDPQLKEAQIKAVIYIEQNFNLTVKKVKLHRFKYSLEMWSALMYSSGGTSFCEYMGNMEGVVNPFPELLKWLVGRSKHTLPAIGLGIGEKFDALLASTNEKFLKCLEELKTELKELLGEDGILLYPSHPLLAPYHNEPMLHPFNFSYTGLFNALGLPVTQCPLGLSSEGLPMGMQIICSMFNDHLSLALARELEHGLGGWTNPGHIA
ncbi:hypothetical protein ScPMuIL_013363 [Solemya velum]